MKHQIVLLATVVAVAVLLRALEPSASTLAALGLLAVSWIYTLHRVELAAEHRELIQRIDTLSEKGDEILDALRESVALQRRSLRGDSSK
jgi:hypothetical protein